jgi:hypothetical protein
MADFIPIHVTKDGADTDGLREFSASDDVFIPQNLTFNNNNGGIYFSNSNGSDRVFIQTLAIGSDNRLQIRVKTPGGSNRTAISVFGGDGDTFFGDSTSNPKGAVSFQGVIGIQLPDATTDPTTYGSNSEFTLGQGSVYYNETDDKIKYYDGSAWQKVASEAYVTANAGGGGVTPEFFMFLG